MKFPINNGYLVYDRVGQGLPLFFIHGYPLSRKIWQPQSEGLSNLATILSLDLRGHGESFPFEPPYSMDLLAEDCKAFLDAIGIPGPYVICGLSMGGYVTFALYRKYPQLFKGMILTSTRAAADSYEGKASRDASIKTVLEQGIPKIVDGMLPKIASPLTYSATPGLVDSIRNIMLQTSVQGVVGALQGMRSRPDSTPLLPTISCPTLVIHGVDDQIIPLHEAELMQSQIPGSRLATILHAGHLANMEQPNLFNQAVRDFLSTL